MNECNKEKKIRRKDVKEDPHRFEKKKTIPYLSIPSLFSSLGVQRFFGFFQHGRKSGCRNDTLIQEFKEVGSFIINTRNISTMQTPA